MAAYPFLIDFFWQQFIIMVILVNSLGAGGDLVAVQIVARQVARGGRWVSGRDGRSGGK